MGLRILCGIPGARADELPQPRLPYEADHKRPYNRALRSSTASPWVGLESSFFVSNTGALPVEIWKRPTPMNSPVPRPREAAICSLAAALGEPTPVRIAAESGVITLDHNRPSWRGTSRQARWTTGHRPCSANRTRATLASSFPRSARSLRASARPFSSYAVVRHSQRIRCHCRPNQNRGKPQGLAVRQPMVGRQERRSCHEPNGPPIEVCPDSVSGADSGEAFRSRRGPTRSRSDAYR
jgi:hypothetical protein